MRERLIALLKTPHKAEKLRQTGTAIGDYEDDCIEAMVADFLLANGVIVLPVKVGQTVYFPMETNGECEPYIDVGTVFCIGFDERHTMWISARYESGLKYYHTSDDFGKTVFLTRDEAEKALKGMEGERS